LRTQDEILQENVKKKENPDSDKNLFRKNDAAGIYRYAYTAAEGRGRELEEDLCNWKLSLFILYEVFTLYVEVCV
jgi:hypothetical protein